LSYIDDIEAAFAAHPEIAEYRINLTQFQTLGIGIRDNDVGSVYSPFSFRQSTNGEFLVQWTDQRLSRGKLNSNSLAMIDRLLAIARQSAYVDPDAAQFLGPQTIKDVPIFADEVQALFDTRAGYLLDVIAELQAIGQRYRVTTLDGGAGGGVGQNWLRTSQGLQLDTPGTVFNYSASFDGMIGQERSQPTIAPIDEIATEIDRVGSYFEHLARPATSPMRDGTRLVIFHPDVAYSMFNHYIWSNLSGAAVYHGRSPLKIDDFQSRRCVFRPDLNVTVDPWKPLSPGSFRYTPEGVPSAPTVYIERGCLTQPVLDLKYARRLNLPPTTPPQSEQIVSIQAEAELGWDELLPDLDEAILVLSMLGLNTQDRSSGNYSVSTGQALMITGGEIQGRVKALLTGNIFAHLRDSDLRLVRFPGQHSPGFALKTTVAIEQMA
jgi:PmbA protein